MPSEITVVRAAGGYRDRARSYKVVIDGKVQGSVKAGDIRSFPVAQGDHTLSISIDWCSSRTILVTLRDEPVVFACSPGGQAPLAAITTERGSYIDLWQIDDVAQAQAIPVVPLIAFRGRPGALPVPTVTSVIGIVIILVGGVGMRTGEHLNWHDAVVLLGLVVLFGSAAVRAVTRRRSRRAAKPR